MSDNFKMLLGTKFTILGSKQTAAFKKDDKGYTILLMPSEQEKNEGITIEKMVADINSLIKGVTGTDGTLTSEAVQNQIGTSVTDKNDSKDDKSKTFDITKIKVILNMAYLYINSTESEKTIEYAFNLTIDAHELIPQDIKFLNIENLTIAIWNTNRTKILDKMALFDPKTYIEG